MIEKIYRIDDRQMKVGCFAETDKLIELPNERVSDTLPPGLDYNLHARDLRALRLVQYLLSTLYHGIVSPNWFKGGISPDPKRIFLHCQLTFASVLIQGSRRPIIKTAKETSIRDIIE